MGWEGQGEASWRRGGCCSWGPLELESGFSVKWERPWQHLTYQELTEVSPPPPPRPPHLTPLIGTPNTEEPTVTAWGLEGSSLRPGQPSPALEDWEGEPVWV